MGNRGDLLEISVSSEWIDYNGHMTDYAYALCFGLAATRLLEAMGIDERYRNQHFASLYLTESRIRFRRENFGGDSLTVRRQLIDMNEISLHVVMYLWNNTSNFLSAESEQLLIHVKKNPAGTVRPSEFPSPIRERINRMYLEDHELDIPDWIGKPIRIRRDSGESKQKEGTHKT